MNDDVKKHAEGLLKVFSEPLDYRPTDEVLWMTRKELSQAIPPAYTEFVGKRLIARVGAPHA